MSTKLTKALEFANYGATINNQIAALKAKTEAHLSYSTNGGTFTIDRELITFLDIFSDRKSIVLLDIHNNPILIDDIPEFYNEVKSRYFEVVNDYHAEYEKLKKKRKVNTVLDLNESGSETN